MIKTKITWHEFQIEEFLEKLGINDDNVIQIEELSLKTVGNVMGDEFSSVLLKLCRSTGSANK